MEILSIKIYANFSNDIVEAKIKKENVTSSSDICYVGYNLSSLTYYIYENSVDDTKPLNMITKNPFSKEEWTEIMDNIRKKANKEKDVGPFSEENPYDDILQELKNAIIFYQSKNTDTFFTVNYIPGLYKAIEIVEKLKTGGD